MSLKKTAQGYAKIMASNQVLSNRMAINLIDQRVMQLIERIDVGEAPERMKNLYAQWQALEDAKKYQRQAEIVVLTKTINAEFEKAYHDYAAWNQMIEVLDLRRKHVDSEIKVIKEMKAILTAEQAYKLVAKLMAVCIRLIKDPKLLRQINVEFSRIIGENDLHEPVEVVDVEEDEEAE